VNPYVLLVVFHKDVLVVPVANNVLKTAPFSQNCLGQRTNAQ
jgi:hypothetical protein